MRPTKPPRLYLRKSGLWVILDQGREIRTGLRDPELAQAALAKYLSGTLRDILKAHLRNHPTKTDFGQHMAKPLIAWWGDMHPSDVTERTCRAYAQHRNKKPATIRHELQFLAAALRPRGSEIAGSWKIWMPPKPEPRTGYFMTRGQAAARLRIARHRNRHICRLILIGVYSGTRPGAALGLSWTPSPTGWFDLQAGLLHRGREISPNKRKGTARIHQRLLAHLRRWKRLDLAAGIEHCIHRKGEPVKRVHKAWNSTALAAGQGPDGPHICRHTCATWLLQSGVSYHEASGFLAMSVEILERTYGHHSPLFQQAAARARGR
jgi:integrase